MTSLRQFTFFLFLLFGPLYVYSQTTLKLTKAQYFNNKIYIEYNLANHSNKTFEFLIDGCDIIYEMPFAVSDGQLNKAISQLNAGTFVVFSDRNGIIDEFVSLDGFLDPTLDNKTVDCKEILHPKKSKNRNFILKNFGDKSFQILENKEKIYLTIYATVLIDNDKYNILVSDPTEIIYE